MSDIAGSEPTQPRGAATVSDEVVEKIAAAAARSVPGVADLGGDVSRFFDRVLDRVGLDEVGDAARGVRADINGTHVTVDIVVVVAANQVVAEIIKAVQVAVIDAVQAYGMTVAAVNVNVDDIELTTPATA
jgi:uncharacterized alkaline shock family protein YloU